MGMGNLIHKKILQLPKVAFYGKRKINKVDLELEIRVVQNIEHKLTVDLLPCPADAHELSICGNIWNNLHTDCVSCGQNLDEIRLLNRTPRVQEICDIWDRWHINGMISGTRPQTAAIDAYKAANPTWRYDYTQACEILKGMNLYEDRGYKYGHAWLCDPLPIEVENRILELFEMTPKVVVTA